MRQVIISELRCLSRVSAQRIVIDARKLMHTAPKEGNAHGKNYFQGIPYGKNSAVERDNGWNGDSMGSRWARHSLNGTGSTEEVRTPWRRSRALRNQMMKGDGEARQREEHEKSSEFDKAQQAAETTPKSSESKIEKHEQTTADKGQAESKDAEAKKTEAKPKMKPRRVLRPRKALISLTPQAVDHLRQLLESPDPKMIRIGVQNRGCSGLTYHLEYVDKPGKYDESVEQDGVKVFIDSKALFSVVGSEMDWLDDKLSSRFIFKNPNSKGTCGCGESFMV